MKTPLPFVKVVTTTDLCADKATINLHYLKDALDSACFQTLRNVEDGLRRIQNVKSQNKQNGFVYNQNFARDATTLAKLLNIQEWAESALKRGEVIFDTTDPI